VLSFAQFKFDHIDDLFCVVNVLEDDDQRDELKYDFANSGYDVFYIQENQYWVPVTNDHTAPLMTIKEL